MSCRKAGWRLTRKAARDHRVLNASRYRVAKDEGASVTPSSDADLTDHFDVPTPLPNAKRLHFPA